MEFGTLALNDAILKALTEQNYTQPTAIQAKTIPLVLDRKDVIASAQTGTGKTAAFDLPLLQLIDTNKPIIQAIVLAPTRELGQQIHRNLTSFAANSPAISIAVICGGIPIKPQIERLKKSIILLLQLQAG